VIHRAVCVAVVGLIAATFAPASSSAFTKAIWGAVYRNGVNQFPLYHKLGVGIYEMDLEWDAVAPTQPMQPTNPSDPAYHWPAPISQAIALARTYHMRVLLQIDNAPPWANGGHQGIGWAPRNPADYAAFAAAAARRYPSVHLWMVWGEPVRQSSFMPFVAAQPGAPLDAAERAAPHLYARILDATYGALKHISRSNLVIGGSTYTTGIDDPQQWIENLKLPDGKPPRMDMYAHNPFSYESPNFDEPPSPDGEVQFSDLHELAGWVNRYLGHHIPLFLSEFTIPTAPDLQFNFYVSPRLAAKWVSLALREARAWHDIYALGWVNVYDAPPTSYGGLLTASGVPKPDFVAFEHG
jgi:hypothetical protein